MILVPATDLADGGATGAAASLTLVPVLPWSSASSA